MVAPASTRHAADLPAFEEVAGMHTPVRAAGAVHTSSSLERLAELITVPGVSGMLASTFATAT